MKRAIRKALDGVRARLPSSLKRSLRPAIAKAKQYFAKRAISPAPVSSISRRRYFASAKQVVFVSDIPRVREAKLAHGLRRKGWTVLLLHGGNANYDLQRYFDDAISFRHPDDAIEQALKLSPVAYHVFSPSGDLVSTELIKARPGPMVFDPTDLLEIVYRGSPERVDLVRYAIDLQAYSLKHCDGYCARDLQFGLSRKVLGYSHGGQVVFFPEYCWGVATNSPQPRGDGPISCVLAGNFGIEKQGEGDWGCLGYGKRFVNAGIALDVYPNWTHYARGEREFREIFSEYFEFASREALFHFHRPVQADELTGELRKHDFGVMLLWGELIGEPMTSVNLDVIPYVTSSRVYDYLDAGLPVLLNKGYRLNIAMLGRYGGAVPVDAGFMNDLGSRMRALPLPELKRNAVRASLGLAVERHSHRLERFYARVAADVGISVG